MYHAFPLGLEELQTFKSIKPLVFNRKTLDELTLKVPEGSSAGTNGNDKSSASGRVEGMDTEKPSAAAPEEGVIPKSSPFSWRQAGHLCDTGVQFLHLGLMH